MSEKKLYRTVITYEVLSDRPIADLTFTDVAYECREGNMSGMALSEETEEVSEERMSELLLNQGSDPDFLLGSEEEDAYFDQD